MQCSLVISYLADMPCPGPFPSSDLYNHLCFFSYEMFVFLSRYVMFNTPFHLCLCGC